MTENQWPQTPNTTPAEVTSELMHLNVAGRYVLRPEASRAPVGSRVSVLGAGFMGSGIAGVAARNLTTLMDFRYKRDYAAGNGRP